MSFQRRTAIGVLALPTGFVAALPHVLGYAKNSLIARGDDDNDEDDDDDDRKKRMLAKGAIIGIAIGVVAFVVLAALASAYFCHQKIKKKRQKRDDAGNEINDKEKSKTEEDTQKNINPGRDTGLIAAGGNTVDAPRNAGTPGISSPADDTSRPMNTLVHNYEMTAARNRDNNLDVETATHVGGSHYEMNTARTVVSENQGLSNFRNTIISVGSTENDDENHHHQTSEKYIYGGPAKAPPPSPPPQYSAPEERTKGHHP